MCDDNDGKLSDSEMIEFRALLKKNGEELDRISFESQLVSQWIETPLPALGGGGR